MYVSYKKGIKEDFWIFAYMSEEHPGKDIEDLITLLGYSGKKHQVAWEIGEKKEFSFYPPFLSYLFQLHDYQFFNKI